jgi:hypothetical protein
LAIRSPWCCPADVGRVHFTDEATRGFSTSLPDI